MTNAQQTRLQRVMETHRCSAETAQRYIDLRDEGYSIYQAKLMSGLIDPDTECCDDTRYA